MGTFQISKVEDRDLQDIIEQLKSDPLRNLFAIYDMLHEPEESSMFAAYGSDNSLRAHLVVHREPRI